MWNVIPKIVQKDTKTILTITENEKILREGQKYIIRYTPVEIYKNEESSGCIEIIKEFSLTHSTNKPIDTEVVSRKGMLTLKIFFEEEQEHSLRIYNKETGEKIGQVFCYSLAEDLFSFYPYKGDIHMHSLCSDGVETPEQVVIECRKAGYDFMALTDHGKYEPSVRCQKIFEEFNGLLQIYRGEEIHLPHHQVHILNINGNQSVNSYFSNNPDAYAKEIEIEKEKIKENLPSGVDSYMLAATKWAFGKIKEYKGMSIYCHPYWRREAGYNQCAALTDAILERQEFDAFELISGYEKQEIDSNVLQVAKYYEMRGRGKNFPIVGVSDGHDMKDSDLFQHFYTIVFAQSATFMNIKQGVMQFKSVAVEHLKGETLRAYGDYRMVKYALFCIREIFPEHDKLAEKESKIMELFLTGKKCQEKEIQIKKQMKCLHYDMFGGNV